MCSNLHQCEYKSKWEALSLADVVVVSCCFGIRPYHFLRTQGWATNTLIKPSFCWTKLELSNVLFGFQDLRGAYLIAMYIPSINRYTCISYIYIHIHSTYVYIIYYIYTQYIYIYTYIYIYIYIHIYMTVTEICAIIHIASKLRSWRPAVLSWGREWPCWTTKSRRIRGILASAPIQRRSVCIYIYNI